MTRESARCASWSIHMKINMGQRIQFLRQRAGMTQEELSKRTHKSRGVIGHYETGRQDIPFDTLCEIAEALDIPMATLCAEELEVKL